MDLILVGTLVIMNFLFLAVTLYTSCISAGFAAEPAENKTSMKDRDWPAFLGPFGNGKSEETGILKAWPETGPPLLWHKQVGESYSPPSIADGKLFLFDRHGEAARLTCLKSDSGEELWRTEYRSLYEDYYGFGLGPKTAPTIDGPRVYTFGVEGMLRCQNVKDGSLIWEVDTAAIFGVVQNFFGVGSSPVVEGDLLIAMIGGSPPNSPKVHSGHVQGDGSCIVAFDKLTGEVCYKSGDELAGYASPVIATHHGRRWGFVFTRGGLLGFEPKTGKIDFHYPWRAAKLESVNASNPVVVDDTVFITESYGLGSSLLRFRPGGYELIRKDPPKRNQTMACHWSTPIYHEGYLYGSHGQKSGDAELRCINYLSGEIMWRQRGLHRATLLFVDRHLVVLGEYGDLHLIEATPRAYRLLASVKPTAVIPGGSAEPRPLINHPAWNAPVLSGGLLYLKGKDRLVCLELIARK